MERLARRLLTMLLVGLLAGSVTACYTILTHPNTDVTDDSPSRACIEYPLWYCPVPYFPGPAPPVRPINPKEPVKRDDGGTEAKSETEPVTKRVLDRAPGGSAETGGMSNEVHSGETPDSNMPSRESTEIKDLTGKRKGSS